MTDLIRDTTFGQIVRFATGNKRLLYPEEHADFKVPDCYTTSARPSRSSSRTAVADLADAPSKGKGDLEKANEDATKPVQASVSVAGQRTDDGFVLVDWYGPQDPSNPQNWTSARKLWVSGVVTALTFAVYVSAAIITPGFASITEEFGVSEEVVALVLALYVLAYGTGPLIFSPLSELPSLGRNPLYVAPYALVFFLSIGIPLTPSIAGLLVLRFLTGFLASPALATGGASLADVISPARLPYAFIGWSLGAVAGPSIGPTLSTFAIQRYGTWRASMWIQLGITGFGLLTIFFGLPETSAPNILLRRARRLRKLTGNDKLRSQSEISAAGLSLSAVLKDAMIKPFEISIKDPAVMFSHLLIAFVYATYYLFFTAFPLVLQGIYGWSVNGEALAFISIVVGIGISAALYSLYYWKVGSKLPWDHQERRLDTALVAVVLAPIGLFLYAWTARPEVSPYVGLLGVALFSASVFVVFQTILFYISLSYVQYAASILSANDALRSTIAASVIMAGLPFYRNLGIAVATSILGGISVLFIPLLFLLHQYGDRLRARSTFAVSP